jgi:hypothetical protein
MTRRLVAAVCALALFAGPAPSDPPSKQFPPVPSKQLPLAVGRTELWLTSGGLGPPRFSVKLEGDTLRYQAEVNDPSKNEVIKTDQEIKPTPEQWREFWKSMDEVGLWTWRPNYREPMIFDGHHWGVMAVHGGRSIQSMGANLYPGQTPAKTGSEARLEISPAFVKYLAAVRKLIGDRPFY